jgi:hypothetical protein
MPCGMAETTAIIIEATIINVNLADAKTEVTIISFRNNMLIYG